MKKNTTLVISEEEIQQLLREKYNVPENATFIPKTGLKKIANTNEGSILDKHFSGYEIKYAE